MDTKQLQGLMEAYTQMYAPQNVEEGFEDINDISDEELLEICEEVICEMINEGYDLTDCDFLIESENLDEAMGRVRSALSSALKKVGGKMAGSAGSYRMVRRGGKLVQPKREKVKKAIGKLGRKLVSAGERIAPAKKEAPVERKTTKALPGTAARKALPPAKEARPKATTKTIKALPPAKTSDRQAAAQAKLAKASAGSTSKGVRFAGEKSGQVAGQRVHTGKGEALEKHRKKAGIAEGVDIFDIVLEYLQTEGYENPEQLMTQLSFEEIDAIIEATYSAKAARAGKDIGKPGKQFAQIAASAAERYGSKERGEKVAGAVLAKLRAKRG